MDTIWYRVLFSNKLFCQKINVVDKKYVKDLQNYSFFALPKTGFVRLISYQKIEKKIIDTYEKSLLIYSNHNKKYNLKYNVIFYYSKYNVFVSYNNKNLN